MGLDGRWSELSGWLASYLEEMVLRIWGLKKNSCWRSIVQARGWVFRIWSKLISLDLNRQKVEIWDTTRCIVHGGGVCIECLAYAYMICVSLLVSPRAEAERNKPIRIRNNRVGMFYYWCIFTLYDYITSSFTIWSIVWGIKGFNTFPQGIRTKVNAIAQHEFELTDTESAIQYFFPPRLTPVCLLWEIVRWWYETIGMLHYFSS